MISFSIGVVGVETLSPFLNWTVESCKAASWRSRAPCGDAASFRFVHPLHFLKWYESVGILGGSGLLETIIIEADLMSNSSIVHNPPSPDTQDPFL